MTKTDTSFERGGRTLAEWLPGLVSEDPDERFDAAEAVGGMWKGTEAYSSNEPIAGEAGRAERFAAAVREAVDGAGFPKAEFVRELMRYRMALNGERRAESLQPPGMVSYLVFQSLGTALMAAEDMLAEMMGDETLGRYAREALVRIGTAGKRFVPALLRELDAIQSVEHGFEGAEALAAIGRGDPAVVAELVERLRGGSDAGKAGVAEVLEEWGEDVAGRGDEAVELLRGLLRSESTWGSGLLALASVGRGRADVVEEVIAWARPREPRWVSVKQGKYPKRVDAVMGERGVAIDALRYFVGFPAEVVPVLADAVETFEEYDADLRRGDSEHERVMTSLRAFGPAAAAAVSVLERHVRQADGDWDWEVVRTLGVIGPAAREAIPAIEEVRREMVAEGVEGEGGAPTPESDLVGWALWRIRGQGG